jgi:hypothetical protein
LNETPSNIEFEILLDEISIDTGSEFSEIFLPKSVSAEEPNSPDLPSILLHFSVPEAGSLRVNIIESNHRTVVLEKPLKPVGTIVEGSRHEIRYQIDNQKYQKPRVFYEILPRQIITNLDIIPVRISPIDYSFAQNRVNFPTKLLVSVDILGGDSSSRVATRPHHLSDFLINSKYYFTVNRTKEIHTSLFSASRVWYRFEIPSDGMYMLDFQYMSNNLPIDDLDLSAIRIFSTGGAMIRPEFTNPGNEFAEIPLYVIQNSPSIISQNDRIYFYAEQRNGFGKNIPLGNVDNNLQPIDIGDHHFLNPYSQKGVYWLTWGSDADFVTPPLRMTIENITSVQSTREIGRVVTHTEVANFMPSSVGFEWFMFFLQQNQQTFNITLPFEDLATTEPQKFSVVAQAASTESANNQIFMRINSGTTNYQLIPVDNPWNGSSMFRLERTLSLLVSGANRIEFITMGNNVRKNVKSFSIEWYKNLVKRNNVLSFLPYTADVGRNVQFTISNASDANLFVFQIDSFNQAKLVPLSSGTFIANPTVNARFFVCSPSNFMIPGAAIRYTNLSLLQNLQPHDITLIYPAHFVDGANRLVDIYTDLANYTVHAVALEDVYNYFSGGHPDPYAIRNYLHYLNLHTPEKQPMGAVFIGAGTTDHRNITSFGQTRNHFPINQLRFRQRGSLMEYRTTITSDDYFVQFNTSNHPEIIVGRIPVQTTAEFTAYLDKLAEYYRNPYPGWWQYTFQFIADDENYRQSNTDWAHTVNVEKSFRDIRNSILVDKLFACDYPLDAFKRKPHVRNMLVDKINEGRLYWVYFGHGSIRNCGDEGYFNANDIPLLTNRGKYPIFWALSCNVGQFDVPEERSLVEELVVRPRAGAINAIGATRETYSSDNEPLLRAFLRFSLNEKTINPEAISGKALQLAKVHTGSSLDSRNPNYNIMGDPFLKVALPQIAENMSFNSTTTSFSKREKISILGEFDNPDVLTPIYNIAFDAGRIQRFPLPSDSTFQIYRESLPIFNGSSSINNGAFEVKFIIPEAASAGSSARVVSLGITADRRAYVNRMSNITILDAIAEIDNITQPSIAVFLDGMNFNAGDTVSPNPTLFARIEDPYGLVTNGSPGRNMMIQIDNSTDIITATSGFVYDINSYTAGTLTWQLTGLSPGHHTAVVTAYNSLNQPSAAETWFVTNPTVNLRIENPLAYPNPITTDGYFTFNLSHRADVTIEIFTITGRRIKTIQQPNLRAGYNQIFWDGRDGDRDRIARGTYFYTIKANATESKGTTTIREKFVKW